MLRSLGLLLWKNHASRTRHCVWTLVEIFLPTIICFIVCYSYAMSNESMYDPVDTLIVHPMKNSSLTSSSGLKSGLNTQPRVPDKFSSLVPLTRQGCSNGVLNDAQYKYDAFEYHAAQRSKTFSVVIVIAYLLLIPSVTKRVVEEEEKGIKQLLVVMGFQVQIIWLAWLIHYMLIVIVSASLITVLWTAPFNKSLGAFIPHTDWSLLWTFLMLYGIAGVVFCFALSTFFSNPSNAMVLGVLLWNITLIMPLLPAEEMSMSLSRMLIFCILPNEALYIGFHLFYEFEVEKNGLFWHHFLEGAPGHRGTSMAHVFLMFITGIIIFGLITFCAERAKMGKSEIPRAWYKLRSMCTEKFSPSLRSRCSDIEVAPSDEEICMRVENISKAFFSLGGDMKIIVDGICMNIYKNKITVILGHNGAGKTTFLSLLSGMRRATSGTVFINEVDILKKRHKIRQSIGFCPQESIFLPDLTVLEQIQFFAMLKGVRRPRAKKRAKKITRVLQLDYGNNLLPQELSLEARRGLSLAIALAGKPDILMLDEPTANVKNIQRMWNLFLKLKEDRTIVLTTNSMKEAEVLADYIAILAHGKLLCYGSSSFLRNMYCTDYHLSVRMKASGDLQMYKLGTEIKKFVPDAEVNPLCAKSLVCTLPSQQKNNFPKLLTFLEKDPSVANMEMSAATIEDIFLRVLKLEQKDVAISVEEKEDDDALLKAYITGTSERKLKGCMLFCQHLLALNLKKCIHVHRRWLVSFLLIFLVLLLIVPTVLETERRADMGSYWTKPEDIMKHLNMTGEGSTGSRAFYYYALSPDCLYLWPYGETCSEAWQIPISDKETNLPHSDIELQMLWIWGPPGAFIFLVASFIELPQKEASSKFKELQFMAGVSPSVYWIVNFFWDFIMYEIAVALGVLVLYMVDTKFILFQPESMFSLFLVLTLYGISGSASAYYSSLLAKTLSSGFAVFILVNVFGMIFVQLGDPINGKEEFFGTAILLLYPIPAVPFVHAIRNIHLIAEQNYKCKYLSWIICPLSSDVNVTSDVCCDDNCTTAGCYTPLKYLEWATKQNPLGVLRQAVYLVLDAVLYWILVFIIDLRWYIAFSDWVTNTFSEIHKGESHDEDVIQEKERIEILTESESWDGEKEVLMVREVAREYCTTTPVRDVSFSVLGGECMGILGIDGSGKTVLIQMLAGQITPSRGEIYYFGKMLRTNRKECLKQIGYCPQSDAVLPTLTGKEMLSIMAYLRGIQRDRISVEVNHCLKLVDLEEYCDLMCGIYACGNRRRVSVAMALIGNPSIVLLDQPTNSLDPVARRKVWDLIVAARHAGQTIVLISSSIAECETLCDKIAIISEGQFSCIGNTEYLKKKFASGFAIFMRLNARIPKYSEQLKALTSEMANSFQQIDLIEEHHFILHYLVSKTDVPWSHLFGLMQDIVQKHPIVLDYSIGHESLEETFVSVTSKRGEGTDFN